MIMIREGKTDRFKHQIKMFLLIWATLFFSVRDSNADSSVNRICAGNGFCITLNEGEITAEAGLCAVIPCSFTTGSDFTPKHIVWSKCEAWRSRCIDSDMILHTNKNNPKIQPGFRGRVSLLEPDVNEGNCSIIINDLTKSDSGSYQLRVNGLLNMYTSDGFTFNPRATVYVKDLMQKPTLMTDTQRLTEGKQTTLTCTAPGLCSGSVPQITWMWRRAGERDSHITGNVTAVKNESVTSVAQRYSSTLTFDPSAEHHGTNITCKVSFTNNIITEETVTLNVTYVKEVKITGNTSMKEGETLNLTCSVESFPPSLVAWTKFSDKNMQNGTKNNLQNDTFTDLQNDTETYPQEEKTGMVTYSISNVTAEDSGRYICTAKYLNNTLMEKVDVTVIYRKKPVITGNRFLEQGDALNLTCSAESFPPSHITWTILGSNKKLHNESSTYLLSNTGSATLVIHNVAVEHSGKYICTAQYLNTTVAVYANVTVTLFPKILKDSGCKVQSEVRTCVCMSRGIPLPTINWPLLKEHTEYSIITSVSNHMVNSSITLHVKNGSNATVECVSSNENGEARENLTIRTDTPEKKEQSKEILKIVSRLEVIIAFFSGLLLSAVICCLATKCHRKKQKSSGNLDHTLEMTSQADPLIDDDEAAEDDQTYYQEAAEEEEEGGGGGAVAAEKVALNLDNGRKDVEYASIDFSVLKRKSNREAAKTQETTETEYAEIKKVKEEREDNDREEVEVEEAMKADEEEEEEIKDDVPEEEEGEDMAVYSNVKDIMSEI